MGALAYADGLTLLAPSPAALRRLLYICEQFGTTNMLRFNPDKTQCIKFSRSCTNGSCSFLFCGKSILCARSVVHLGHVLTCNLMDNADILRCSHDFLSKKMVFCLGLVFVILLYRPDCSLITICPCMAVLCGLLIVMKLNT